MEDMRPSLEPDQDRWAALEQLDSWLERPMLVLSFAWLGLVLIELLAGEAPALEIFGTAIWIAFIVEFALRFILAPSKKRFLRDNWLTTIALIVPAFRILRSIRVLRTAKALRGMRLVKVVGTANRSMNALGESLGRRGLGYVLATTTLVAVLGAAGMLAFEPAAKVEGGFRNFGDALWWSSMLITTIGSQTWPATTEGRILCFLLSLYGLAVFGYITASLASFFVERDAGRSGDARSDIQALRSEIEGLRAELKATAAKERR
jgi:voltage-gated potassium channel